MAATESVEVARTVAEVISRSLRSGRKHHYRVDLLAQQNEAASNYHRLIMLLPELRAMTGRELLLHDRLARFVISGQARYTSFVTIHYDHPLPGWFEPWSMEVSLYHDACMAEVVRCMRHRTIAAIHDYPNRQMHQVDEKWQLNRFLGEWLLFCLEQGRAATAGLPLMPAG